MPLVGFWTEIPVRPDRWPPNVDARPLRSVTCPSGLVILTVLRAPPSTKKILDTELYPGYTDIVKTAISLPDALYADAEEIAKSMGIPRSRLYARALEEFLNHHKKERITEKLNEVYGKLETMDIQEISAVSLKTLREITKNDTWWNMVGGFWRAI